MKKKNIFDKIIKVDLCYGYTNYAIVFIESFHSILDSELLGKLQCCIVFLILFLTFFPLPAQRQRARKYNFI